jgi:DNA-directed RNA polymerase specialized sigma24 family protein
VQGVRQVLEQYLKNDFGADAVRPKTERTVLNTEHIIRAYLIPRWGEEIADDIKSFLAHLREVLRRDFLDFVRSKRATTSVYPDDERADGQDLSESTIHQRVASYGNPEDEHLQSERLVWLVEQFKDDPELLEILRLQLEPAGYNAFSSQELAKRLSTTVVEIENRRRRVIRRLRKLADASLIEEAQHV